MYHRLYRYHVNTLGWHHFGREALLFVLLAVVLLLSPSASALRFRDRSLYMNNATPGAVSSYTVTFRYMSPQQVSSVDMLFCNDPIPYHDCVAPTGLDVSQAVLSNQTGETGYSILSQDTNHIILTRPPATTSSATTSSYTFDNIINPTDTSESFAIRLRSHASSDATGPKIDFGSVLGQATTSVEIETQVPPMLVFCLAEEVDDNCMVTNKNYYKDMGTLGPDSTLTAQSQMAVGTNASGGFAITANGSTMSAGLSTIDGLNAPTESKQGTNQFGINLVANDQLGIGGDPHGDWANAVAADDYSQPNRFKYVSGDVVAYSPNVSLMKKFTVSYIVNSKPDLRAGVYTTTINYIASGRF